MKFREVILYGVRVMMIFAKWFHVFHERSDDKQGDYRAHYVNCVRDLLRSRAIYSHNSIKTLNYESGYDVMLTFWQNVKSVL